MKRAVNLCTLGAAMLLSFLFFIPFVAEEGSVIYAFLYALAFAVPSLTVLLLARALGAETEPLRIGIDKAGIRFTLPLVVPCVLLVILLSELTSLVLSLFGLSYAVTPNGSLFSVFAVYAVIPAIGEELLFRYLPIRLISPHSRKAAVLISALLFALVHVNLFQLPYAFFAGVIFVMLDLACGSVLPSVFIHLVNNVLSILIALFPSGPFGVIMLVSLAVMTLLSFVAIVRQRSRYGEEIKTIISHGSVHITAAFIAVAVISLILAILLL